MGRGRPRAHRLLDGPRRALPRPLPSRGGEGHAGAGRARHPSRRLARAGGPLGRAGLQAHPLGGDGALHHVRHRGHASGDADRPRLHRPAPRAEVPRPLPRLARRRGGGGEPALRRAHVGGRPRRDPGPAPPVPAQRHQGGGHAPAAGRRGRRHPRARGRPVRHHAHHPRLPSGIARGHRAARRGPHLRRGHHRLPLLARRRPGLFRRHPGHDHARPRSWRAGSRAAPWSARRCS